MATWSITGSGFKDYAGSGVIDVIDFNTSGLTMADIDAAKVSPRLTLLGSSNVDNLHIELAGNGGFNASGFRIGTGWSQSADMLSFDDSRGNNTIVGSAFADRFFILGGSDSIAGGAGEDTLVLYYIPLSESFTTTGAGTIAGSGGTSIRFSGIEKLQLILGNGTDRIVGLGGADDVRAGGGNDTVRGAGGDDDLFGSSGIDHLIGGHGRDDLDGGYDGDRLEGAAGNDTLTGDLGHDVLLGGDGADRLYASTDRTYPDSYVPAPELDVLTGGLGRDVLFGGTDAGGDVFAFRSTADSRTGSTVRDVIHNFTSGSDSIDLRAIDAKAGSTLNNQFGFSNQTATANSVWWKVVDAGVVVRADVSGDKTADMEILLKGIASLSVGDFDL